MSTIDRELIGEDAMLAFGASVARLLRAGDRVLLYGNLGAGKTTLVRGMLFGLSHPDPREVASPTFALHHRYEGGRLPVDHLDLYRLQAPVSLAREGLDTVMSDVSNLVVVEWPDRLDLDDVTPDVIIKIDFLHEGARSVQVHGRKGLESLSEQLGVPQ